MLVPQWEVFLAGIVEYGLIAWMTIGILLSLRRRYNDNENFRARFKYPVAIYLSLRRRVNVKSETFKNPVKKLKDAPSFFNVRLSHDEEPEPVSEKIVAREEGLKNTEGSQDSGVDTEKPRSTPVPSNIIATVGMLEPIEKAKVIEILQAEVGEKKTAEIVEGGKPNLDSTPSKPSQLPASTTAQVSDSTAQIRQDRERDTPKVPASTTAQTLPTKSKKLRELEERMRKKK